MFLAAGGVKRENPYYQSARRFRRFISQMFRSAFSYENIGLNKSPFQDEIQPHWCQNNISAEAQRHFCSRSRLFLL
jgi:hypothetical protein